MTAFDIVSLVLVGVWIILLILVIIHGEVMYHREKKAMEEHDEEAKKFFEFLESKMKDFEDKDDNDTLN